MEEDSVIELEEQTIVIVNPEWHETVIYIKEAFSSNKGYYANCLVFKLSDSEWGRSKIYDSFLAEYEDDIEYADSEYKRFALMTMFEGDKEDIDLEE